MVEEKIDLDLKESVIDELNKMYQKSEDTISADAMVSRAYTDRVSVECINKKIDSQMNAITAGIRNINPKFKEGSKNYDQVKQEIVAIMAKYESNLIELSKFYDTKIEQLILRKAELEAKLAGIFCNTEYLKQQEIERLKQKNSDKVKTKIADGIKKVLEKIKGKKENKQIDSSLINRMKDNKDIELEMSEKLNKKVEETQNEANNNKLELEKVEKEIRLTNDEIKRLNNLKKEALTNAMEIGEKSLDINIKKPKVFTKLTRFIISRFNTPKVIKQTILDPLNERIENFKNNELSNMKGE